MRVLGVQDAGARGRRDRRGPPAAAVAGLAEARSCRGCPSSLAALGLRVVEADDELHVVATLRARGARRAATT